MKSAIINLTTIPEVYSSFARSSLEEVDNIVVDLRSITWFQPWHLVLCASIKEFARLRAKQFNFTDCGSSAAYSYANRMGLFENYPFNKYESNKFFEICHINSDNQNVWEGLQKVLSNFGSVVPDVFRAFTEVADNIYYHSGETEDHGWGYAHAQVVNDELLLAFCDLGVGYYETYRRNDLVKGRSRQQIIEDSLDLQVSCRNVTTQERGLGLHEVCKFLDSFRGVLEIYSDGIYCSYQNETKSSKSLGVETKGALLCITVPIK